MRVPCPKCGVFNGVKRLVLHKGCDGTVELDVPEINPDPILIANLGCEEVIDSFTLGGHHFEQDGNVTCVYWRTTYTWDELDDDAKDKVREKYEPFEDWWDNELDWFGEQNPELNDLEKMYFQLDHGGFASFTGWLDLEDILPPDLVQPPHVSECLKRITEYGDCVSTRGLKAKHTYINDERQYRQYRRLYAWLKQNEGPWICDADTVHFSSDSGCHWADGFDGLNWYGNDATYNDPPDWWDWATELVKDWLDEVRAEYESSLLKQLQAAYDYQWSDDNLECVYECTMFTKDGEEHG